MKSTVDRGVSVRNWGIAARRVYGKLLAIGNRCKGWPGCRIVEVLKKVEDGSKPPESALKDLVFAYGSGWLTAKEGIEPVFAINVCPHFLKSAPDKIKEWVAMAFILGMFEGNPFSCFAHGELPPVIKSTFEFIKDDTIKKIIVAELEKSLSQRESPSFEEFYNSLLKAVRTSLYPEQGPKTGPEVIFL